jgi:regulator of replication initiation timing
MNWLAHPLTVTTYAVVISLFVAGAKALFQLFQRVKSLESSIDALHTEVSELSVDLRNHMVEETRNVQHLERSLNRVLALLAEQNASQSRIGLRD